MIVKPIVTIHYSDDIDLNQALMSLSIWPGMSHFGCPANPPYKDDDNRLLFIANGYVAERITGGEVGDDDILAKLYYRPNAPVLMQLLYTTSVTIGQHLWYFINHDVPIAEDKITSSNYSAMPIHNEDIPKLLAALRERDCKCTIGINTGI